ncbi:MAG: phosphotransferase, partial [Chloroflexota bacterium]|nr:phosphotransferase [Chloroflexota bacterium]
MMQARHDEHPEPHEFSERLGTISPAQFQAALDRFGLGRLVGAEPITLGNFGQNCFLHSTAGAFVLRGAPHYPWQFLEEQLFARLLHEYTPVPVPWPYYVDESAAIFGWPYAIMPRLPGRPLADKAFRGPRGGGAATEIGRGRGPKKGAMPGFG